VSKNRLIVLSVVLEGRPISAAAADYGVSARWVRILVARYRDGGWDAVEPRSRRPHTSPSRTAEHLEDDIVVLRRALLADGHDAGADTISAHLQRRYGHSPSTATIWRILRRHRLVTPTPKKRPRSSYTRFEADLPNETWQSDFTHWRLAPGTGVEILTFLDDHSRYALNLTAYPVVTGPIVLAAFRATIDEHGPPASTLTDNGLVFTTRSRKGRNAFENELRLLGIDQRNGRPNHPQTQGKVERFQQTLKKWLTAHPPATTIHDLQTQLDQFRDYYNHQRPHRSLQRRTPAETYSARAKAGPAGTVDGHWRIRDDRIDDSGVVTIRYHSKLHHIGIGRAHKGTRVKILIHDRHIRIVSNIGELLRELILDPSRDYQPQKPQNPLPKEGEM
jgi:transposase InsO family protein